MRYLSRVLLVAVVALWVLTGTSFSANLTCSSAATLDAGAAATPR